MKYSITMGCGHKDLVELYGRSKDRDARKEYLETFGICRECYKKKMQEENERSGMHLYIEATGDIDEENGDILLYLYIDGNTKPHKEKLKELGFRWGARSSSMDCLSERRTAMCWHVIIDSADLKKTVEDVDASGIGVELATSKMSLIQSMAFHIAVEKRSNWTEIQKKIAEIDRPKKPSMLEKKRWNRKIYGKSGRFSVYLDGDRHDISDETASELERYAGMLEKYEAMVNDIKKA